MAITAAAAAAIFAVWWFFDSKQRQPLCDPAAQSTRQ
jgi:hypothetical protein